MGPGSRAIVALVYFITHMVRYTGRYMSRYMHM